MPQDTPSPPPPAEGSSLEPFRHTTFTVLWKATVVSNVGTWMQKAAAGWLMTGLDPDPLVRDRTVVDPPRNGAARGDPVGDGLVRHHVVALGR